MPASAARARAAGGAPGTGIRRTHAPTALVLSPHGMPAQQVDGDAPLPAPRALAPRPHRSRDGDAASASQDNRRATRRLGVSSSGPAGPRNGGAKRLGGGRGADRGQCRRVEQVVAHIVRWRHDRRSPSLSITKASLRAGLAATPVVRRLSLWRERRLVLPGAPAPA